jgi:hypothetical protein
MRRLDRDDAFGSSWDATAAGRGFGSREETEASEVMIILG